MPRVVHFEIHAEDPERTGRFYADLFDWKVTRWGEGGQDYWLVRTGPDDGPGINGGMLRRRGGGPEDGQPVNAFVCTVEVPALDDALERLPELGGTLAVPRMPVPGVGWLAYGRDPEGNIFGLMQPDPLAG